jgi:hypothetical protein
MTHYEVLQVMPTASPEVIRMAYKALASKYHPDVFQGNKEYAEIKMKQINEAYRVLSSPISRQEYDRLLQKAEGQNYQTYQEPQSQRPNLAKNKSGFSTLVAILLVLAIPIGLMLLDDAGVFDGNKSNRNYPTENTYPPTAIIPQSGDILSGIEYFDGSQLTITADSGSSYVVKLKTSSGVERLSFYVRAGETVTVGVPAEYLYVYFASGDTWYGKKLLFGEETYYSMDDEGLDFSEYTWEYTLYPVTSGNFSETPIDPDDF